MTFPVCKLEALAIELSRLKSIVDEKKAALEATRVLHDKAREEVNAAFADYNTTHGKMLTLIHGDPT